MGAKDDNSVIVIIIAAVVVDDDDDDDDTSVAVVGLVGAVTIPGTHDAHQTLAGGPNPRLHCARSNLFLDEA
ncbi:unnamed protein product [Heligmosomoides polygyrus]|uniref:Secreted protein n=1 Tax=Heligmosomoides polygyrus TaxID=6339 RepID=A0A183FJE2_HELPZ|nr:unnamed protein product [Heligmosomoides polygyrus]